MRKYDATQHGNLLHYENLKFHCEIDVVYPVRTAQHDISMARAESMQIINAGNLCMNNMGNNPKRKKLFFPWKHGFSPVA